MWLSLVERFVRDEEVACSNHVIPTDWEDIDITSISFFITFTQNFTQTYYKYKIKQKIHIIIAISGCFAAGYML